jgi:signal transduction histidine kinase/ligand-binding sensor domain-containing protein
MRSWQTDDGLPNNEVTALLQGQDGYLWVGTAVGLARFDGVRFKEFAYANPSGREDQGVSALAASRSGGLWMRLRRWPVAYLSPDASHVAQAAKDLPETRPSAIMEDNEGCLWVGYPDSIWQVRNGRATRLAAEPGLPAGLASGFVMDRDGHVWMAKGNYVVLFQQGRFEIVTQTKYRPHLAAARSNGVWVSFGQKLLQCGQTGKLQDYGSFQADPHAGTTAVMEDSSGAVWVGTDSAGLFRRDESGFERIETSHPGILSLAEDREGNIWAGTAGGGLDRLSTRSVQLEGLRAGSSLVGIQSVCEDAGGVLWGASQNGLLVRRVDGQWSAVFSNAPLPEAVLCVAADRGGGVWIGARNRGLYRLREGHLATWDAGAGIAGRMIEALLPAANGDLWIAQQAPTALQCLHDGHVRDIELPGVIGRFTALAEDATGRIWAGSEKGDLMRVEGERLVNEDALTPAMSRSILCLHASPDGALWIGYEGAGLGRLKEGHFSRLGTERGLFDDYISQIASDDEGWFWFGGERGLFKVRREELESIMGGGAARARSIAYGQNEGLFSVEANSVNVSPFVASSALRSRDGRLWIPLRKGLAAVDPKILRSNPAPPPVLLSQVAMDGKVIASYGGVAGRQALANLKTLRGPLELPPNHRRLEIEFTAINLSEPENVHFRCRLDGLDDNWVDAPARQASYSRLTAGQYQFKVEASNGDGPWSQAPATLAFTVSPFVWQTWWFRAGVLALFTSAVIALVRYISFRRLRFKLQTLEQQAALDKERTRIARDLHDDLGCSLTRVALMLEMNEQASPAGPPANGKAQLFSPMVRQVVKSVDEIIWAISPRNDQLQYLLDYIVEFSVEFLHAANIRPHVDVPDHVAPQTISPEVRHNIFLVVKEALNNIARHAQAGEVRFRIAVTQEQLGIFIEDNGRGFEVAPDNTFADGLRNMRQRMEEIGGRLRIESKPGAGTRVALMYVWPRAAKFEI